MQHNYKLKKKIKQILLETIFAIAKHPINKIYYKRS